MRIGPTGAQRHIEPQQIARGIKDALGRRVFSTLLEDLFGYRTEPDGHPFTPVHRALLTLPLRGLVTTNYDPGCWNRQRPLLGAAGTWVCTPARCQRPIPSSL
jgi:hypothetical protein